MQTSNCPCENPIEYCSHQLKFANGVLSLTIGGCTDSIPLNVPGLSPGEVAAALAAVLGAADPAVIAALRTAITNVYNSLTTPSNQVFVSAINQAITQGLITLPPLSCAQITSVFAANGTTAAGAFLLGADCKKYPAQLIADLARMTPDQLNTLLTDASVINGVTNLVNNQIAAGAIDVGTTPPPLTCAAIGAAYTAAPVAPVGTDVLLGNGCKSYTISDVVALASGDGGVKTAPEVVALFPAAALAPTTNTGFLAADGSTYTLAQMGQSLTPSVVSTIGSTVNCAFVSNLFVDSTAPVAAGTTFLAKGCAAYTIEGMAAAAFSSQDPAVVAAASAMVQSIVTCAYVDSLTPVSAAPLTGTEEVKLNGCSATTLAALANYAGLNAPLTTENLLPGVLPADVQVTCASLVAPPVVPAAAGDAIWGDTCKAFSLKLLRSAVIGAELGYVAA